MKFRTVRIVYRTNLATTFIDISDNSLTLINVDWKCKSDDVDLITFLFPIQVAEIEHFLFPSQRLGIRPSVPSVLAAFYYDLASAWNSTWFIWWWRKHVSVEFIQMDIWLSLLFHLLSSFYCFSMEISYYFWA